MASKIELRSLQTILGNMIARMAAEGDFDDLSPGSTFMTILEAAALQDFSLEGKLLRILNLRNIDECSGTDLEKLATEMGLDNSRLGATPSIVSLTISDESFTKISSNIYAGTVAPTAGDTQIRIVEGVDFPTSGKIYLGRGSRTAEVVQYSSIEDMGSYWAINLSGPLTKDHLVGEEIVLAQGGDRVIAAGTTSVVESVTGISPIQFVTQVDYFLQDGEDTLKDVLATSQETGSQSIVGRKKITTFLSQPFSGATVSNEEPSTGGRDEETDSQLRQRIKDHPHTLSRGTETAVVRAVIGVQDDEENKRVVSAYLRRPISGLQQVVLYIDDGKGFSPSFSGVGEEVIVTKATGKESFFQLQKWPLVRTQTVTISKEPFALTGKESLYVEVDGQFEERILAATYRTPNVVTAQEVAEVINKKFTSVEARAKDGLLFISPTADDPDWLRIGVSTIPGAPDANTELRFPNIKNYTMKLYRNDRLMEKNGTEATIQTLPNNQWTSLTGTETLQLKVDNILSPIVTYINTDFRDNTFSNTIAGASLLDWMTIINKTFIGVTASVKDDGTITLRSDKGRSGEASIEVVGGTLSTKLFSGLVSSSGTSPEYRLNKLLGQLEILVPLEAGEELKAGTIHTRGFVLTPQFATYSMPAMNYLAGEIVIVPDAVIEHAFVARLGVITFTAGTLITTLTGATNQFNNVKPNDYCYCFNSPKDGLFRVKSATHNTVTIINPEPQSGTMDLEAAASKLKFFRTEGYPQIAKLPIGDAVTTNEILNSLNSQLTNIKSEEIETGSIRISTTRFDGKGGLSICAVSGSASALNIVEGNYESNDPHFASIESGDLTCMPSKRITVDEADIAAPYNNFDSNESVFTELSSHNKQIFTYLGSNSKLLRQPFEKLSNNNLRLRTQKPTQLVSTGEDTRATAMSGIEVGQGDNMVFLIDNDPARKTFDIPMYVEGTIVGPSVPSRTEFDLLDSSGYPLAADKWLGHRWDDYRVWFQARNQLPVTDLNARMKITSVAFGPNGENIKAGVVYPKKSGSPLIASYSVDPLARKIQVDIQLASAEARSIGLQPSKRVQISSSTGKIRVSFRPPVDLLTVAPGDILSIQDDLFNVANRGSFLITNVNNVFDNGHAYGHYEHATEITLASNKTTLTLSNASPKTVKIGDKVTIGGITRAVTVVTSQTNITCEAPGWPTYPLTTTTTVVVGGVPTVVTSTDNSPIIATIAHQYLSADSTLPFALTAGEVIDIGGVDYTILSVVSPTDFTISPSLQFKYSGLRSGTISRMYVEANKFSTTVSETVITASDSSVIIFELPDNENSAQSIMDLINNTAGIKDLILASKHPMSDGSGVILESTQEVSVGNETHISLKNGESFVYSSQETSPSFRLKEGSTETPDYEEKVRLIPMTPQNIADHFSRKQISGLAVAADIELVDIGRRVQVSSKIAGGEGQVFAVGGRAAGLNVFRIRGNAQELNANTAMIELDRSAIELMAPGHLMKITQSASAKKKLAAPFSVEDQINLQVPAVGYGQIKFSVDVTNIYPFTQSSSTWAIRNIGRNRIRFELYAGTAAIPTQLKVDDWVLVGNGEKYSTITTTKEFSPANQGWFQVRETDNQTYFDVDGKGVEEFRNALDTSFVFCSYHSPRVGDKIVLGADLPISSNNKGTFKITQVVDNSTFIVVNPTSEVQDWIKLGASVSTDVSFYDQGFSTYRTVRLVSPKADDPTNRSQVVLTPGIDMSMFSEGQNAVITMPNRLGFGIYPVPGVSGYSYWTGLKRKVQRVVDAWAPDTATFPGVGAAGVFIEVREPRIQRIKVGMKVKTAKGVALQSLSDTIKSAIAGYINSLGLGDDVVMSEIIKLVQQIPGIDALVLTAPVPDTERVAVGDKSIARISADDITLS